MSRPSLRSAASLLPLVFDEGQGQERTFVTARFAQLHVHVAIWNRTRCTVRDLPEDAGVAYGYQVERRDRPNRDDGQGACRAG